MDRRWIGLAYRSLTYTVTDFSPLSSFAFDSEAFPNRAVGAVKRPQYIGGRFAVAHVAFAIEKDEASGADGDGREGGVFDKISAVHEIVV